MNKKQFADQLSNLINFRTLTDNFEENKKALDYVETLISNKAIVKRLVNNGKELLIAGNKDTNSPDVGYMVHIDVVAGRDDQFDMKRKGDKLIGRGVSDMKFSIPIGAALLNEVIESNSDTSFTFVITTDEETGGYDGAAYLASDKLFVPKALIVPDGGDNFVFVEKAKGVCQVVVEAEGRPAHASRPWMGENAIEPLVQLLSILLDKYGKNNKKESWETTMNIGVIQGGISTNQVCDKAVVKLDFRYPETQTSQQIIDEVKGIAEKVNKGLKIGKGSVGMPTFTDVNLSVVKSFINAFDELGIKLKISPTYGASDARHWAGFKTPVLMSKPIGGEIHSENEWISLNACMSYYEGIKKFLDTMKP